MDNMIVMIKLNEGDSAEIHGKVKFAVLDLIIYIR